jgi:NCS1 family nucleobase:cation symporter-1
MADANQTQNLPEQVELPAPPDGAGDLAPTSIAQRTWTWRDMAGLWISMAACIPSYMLASAPVKQGMHWGAAVFVVLLGNVIVLLPILLNAHPGVRYGIPFPVYCRAAFGIRGAQAPAILRALVACGWFGIQTWIGGNGIAVALAVVFPRLASADPNAGPGALEFACFAIFWLINMAIIWRGIDTVRSVLNWQAPILIAFPLVLLAWAIYRVGGVSHLLEQSSSLVVEQQEHAFRTLFFPTLTAVVGFWSTLALNIPDFSRFTRSQRDQVIGQTAGLPTTMGLYALVGVLVTAATVIIFGKAMWDPVEVMKQFGNPFAVVVAMIAIVIATLSTNLAANVVGPANDIANLSPRHISFRTGALITGCIGIVIMPWKLIADPRGYVFTWLIAYSSLLGAICGVLIADYYIIRRTRLDLAGLYERHGPYWYAGGVNPVAIVALLVAIAPCLPGFLVTTGVVRLTSLSETSLAGRLFRFSNDLYDYAWFVSLAIAAVVHLVGMRLRNQPVR